MPWERAGIFAYRVPAWPITGEAGGGTMEDHCEVLTEPRSCQGHTGVLTTSLIAKEGSSTGMTSWMETSGMCNHCSGLSLVEFGRWSRGGDMHLPSFISTTASQLPKAVWCTEPSDARVFPALHPPACLNMASVCGTVYCNNINVWTF